MGYESLANNTTGSNNTAVGRNAGPNSEALDNTTAIGNGAITTASNQIRIGNSSVTSIGGQVSWSTLSDGRFKRDIREDVSGLDFLNQLKPVSYIIDRRAIESFLGLQDNVNSRPPSMRENRQTGFVAQDVEALIKKSGFVFNGVEAPQNDKDHYSIRYAEFVVPLVKAVQELSAIVEDQQKQIDLLTKMLSTTEFKDEEQASGLELHQNQPNPFQRDTKITMLIPEEVQVATLYVYDLQGKKVEKVEVNERGSASVVIEGGRLSSGIYLYTLIGDGQPTEVKRMILTD